MEELTNQLNIEVRNKIATLTSKNFQLVGGNNDYKVVFDFDDEWSANNVKTALFVFGNSSIAKIFEGNVCEGVAVEKATKCYIGVFSGNIKTTTPAEVDCILQSITDMGDIPQDPTPSVYNQIMEMLDKAIQAHTELPTGGKTGQVLKKQSDADYDTAWENDEKSDLSNYYTKSEVDEKIGGIDLSDYYTKGEIDQKLTEVDVDLSDYYTKGETDDKLADILGEISQGLDDLHQVALSYQIGDIESAMQSLTDAVDGLESEVSENI